MRYCGPGPCASLVRVSNRFRVRVRVRVRVRTRVGARAAATARTTDRLRLRWRQLASGGRLDISVTRMPGTGRGWARRTWKNTLDVLKTAAAIRMSYSRGRVRVS